MSNDARNAATLACLAAFLILCRSCAPELALADPKVFPPFVYPPDMTNHTWVLESSTNRIDWKIIAGPFQRGPAGGSYGIYPTNAMNCPNFYRMRAID